MTDKQKPEALLLHRELLYLAAKNAGTARERLFAALTKAAAELYRQHEELELQKALVAEAQAMTAQVCAENEALRKALAEAADNIEAWGAYASEYFQKKHNLQGDIERARAAMKEKP